MSSIRKRLLKRARPYLAGGVTYVNPSAREMLDLLWPVVQAAQLEFDMPIQRNINRLGAELERLNKRLK